MSDDKPDAMSGRIMRKQARVVLDQKKLLTWLIKNDRPPIRDFLKKKFLMGIIPAFFQGDIMLKKIALYALSAFFAGGAILWFWVAYTQSNPEMSRAAFMIALGPTSVAILLAHKARWIHKPN